MKTQITAFCFALSLLLSSCAKETFFFSNTGTTSYGSKKQTQVVTSIPAEPVAGNTSPTVSAPAAPAENLTATTRNVVVSKKEFTKTKPLYANHLTSRQDQKQDVSKISQAKTAIKVNKEIKTLVKQAKKNMPATAAEGEGKSQVVALILALAVWWAGIHRFYLGYTGIGIVQLLTLGGCGIWALVDIIRILTGDLKPKNGDYTKKL